MLCQSISRLGLLLTNPSSPLSISQPIRQLLFRSSHPWFAPSSSPRPMSKKPRTLLLLMLPRYVACQAVTLQTSFSFPSFIVVIIPTNLDYLYHAPYPFPASYHSLSISHSVPRAPATFCHHLFLDPTTSFSRVQGQEALTLAQQKAQQALAATQQTVADAKVRDQACSRFLGEGRGKSIVIDHDHSSRASPFPHTLSFSLFFFS